MIRKATENDLSDVLKIYAAARKFMSESGNPTQWGVAYPPTEVVWDDINNGYLHVLCEDGKIYAVFAILPNGDSVYDEIDGEWLSCEPYAAVHRVASSGERRGAGRECLRYAIEKYKNVKIDTHRDNAPMRHTLSALGFCECGEVIIENGEKRIAYQYSPSR